MDTGDIIRREKEVQALKEKVRDIEARFFSLGKRIREIEQGRPIPLAFKALVDPDKCIACGICQEICQTGAVTLELIAHVNPARCMGCGSCVEVCPQGAMSLHIVKHGY